MDNDERRRKITAPQLTRASKAYSAHDQQNSTLDEHFSWRIAFQARHHFSSAQTSERAGKIVFVLGDSAIIGDGENPVWRDLRVDHRESPPTIVTVVVSLKYSMAEEIVFILSHLILVTIFEAGKI